MFHCGGTAIAYEVTGHDEYIRDGENAYVVKRDDEDRVVELLTKLRKDPGELQRLKTGALQTAHSWPDWRDASMRFVTALEEIRTTTPPTSRQYLKRHTQRIRKDNQNRLDAREHTFFSRQEAAAGQGALDDFVQLYWHTGEGFNQQNFSWLHFRSNEWTTATLDVEPDDALFHLRIDPSVRVGVIQIRRITISCGASGRKIFIANTRKAWRAVALAGTAKWLKKRNSFGLIASFGNDPQLIMPALKLHPAESSVRVEIELRTMGYSQAMKVFCYDPVRMLKFLKDRLS
jgi:hypothetical protein